MNKMSIKNCPGGKKILLDSGLKCKHKEMELGQCAVIKSKESAWGGGCSDTYYLATE